MQIYLHYDRIDWVLLNSLKNIVNQWHNLISIVAFKNEIFFLHGVNEQIVDIGFFVVLTSDRQHF